MPKLSERNTRSLDLIFTSQKWNTPEKQHFGIQFLNELKISLEFLMGASKQLVSSKHFQQFSRFLFGFHVIKREFYPHTNFQMHEILYELRNHSAGLNCGRWDYIFSFIKTVKAHSDRLLPDRNQVGMTQVHNLSSVICS